MFILLWRNPSPTYKRISKTTNITFKSFVLNSKIKYFTFPRILLYIDKCYLKFIFWIKTSFGQKMRPWVLNIVFKFFKIAYRCISNMEYLCFTDMVHYFATSLADLRGWASLLWRMLGHLYVPREDLPLFHAQNKFVHGKFLFWEGWVDVKVGGNFEDGTAEATQATFLGHRDTPENAMQDASRRAVLLLQFHFHHTKVNHLYLHGPEWCFLRLWSS